MGEDRYCATLVYLPVDLLHLESYDVRLQSEAKNMKTCCRDKQRNNLAVVENEQDFKNIFYFG